MKDEIVKAVVAKTGLPAAQAGVAVDTVLNFLKDKLPAPIGAQIEAMLGGQGGDPTGGLAAGLGNLLGKK